MLLKQRLAAIGQVTSTVSHELRNPLGTISTSIYSIDNKVGGKNLGVDRALDRVKRNIARCDNIISGLLDFTHVRKLQLKSVNFDRWLAGTLKEYDLPPEVAVEQNLTTQVEIPLDEERFRQVMTNVLDNACHAVQENGKATSGKPKLTVETAVVNKRVEIKVQDHGKGISQEDLERIFEPFFTNKTFGVGLGLPVVKKIMEEHHGGIEITSEEGTGTQVLLWLPLHHQKEEGS